MTEPITDQLQQHFGAVGETENSVLANGKMEQAERKVHSHHLTHSSSKVNLDEMISNTELRQQDRIKLPEPQRCQWICQIPVFPY